MSRDDPDPHPHSIPDANGIVGDNAPPPWGSEKHEARMARLLDLARKLPKRPGVYLMKDHKGVVIYIGKALNLPDRVSSYFVPSADLGISGKQKHLLLDHVHTFDHIVCEGEWEALLVENRLIKDIHPRFNARLMDDKTFPYLVVTQSEDFPRVFVTRNPTGTGDWADEADRGSSSGGGRKTPVEKAPPPEPRFVPEGLPKRPDEETVIHLRQLSEVPPDPSAPNTLILSSGRKRDKVFGPFTNAGALREAVQILQRVFKFRTCHLDIIDGNEKNKFFRPCLLYAINQCTAPCAAKITKDAYKADCDRFVKFLDTKRSEMLREMMAEMNEASAALNYEKAAAIRDQIKAIQKLDERADRSDGWQPESELSYGDPKKSLESLQRTLGLAEPIRCIEGIDIAHLQGGETVGSKVCFVDGRPFKSEYRRFKIKSVTNDDYSSIREVVSRRYREAGAGQELYPEVILIDGGLGQLHAGLEAFAQLNIKPPMVISLAKKEEIVYVQERSEPIKLGRENLGLRLLQAVRDEAHRFAQHYHHVLRRKKQLDED